MKPFNEGQGLKNIQLHTRSTSWLSMILILLDIFLICLILLKVFPLGLCPKEGAFCEFLVSLSALSVTYTITLLILRCRQSNENHKLQHWRNPQNVRAAATYGLRTIFVIMWTLTACLSTAVWTPSHVTRMLQDNATEPTEEGWNILNCSRPSADWRMSEVYRSGNQSCLNLLYYTSSGCLTLVFTIAFLWLVMVIFMTNFDRHIGKKTTRIILKKIPTKRDPEKGNLDYQDHFSPDQWPRELEMILNQENDMTEERREQVVQDSITKFKNLVREHQTNWFTKKPNAN